MFTRKKIALFLLTAGIFSFLVAIYLFSLHDRQISSTLSGGVTQQELQFSEGLLAFSIISIGAGSYLVGSLRTKRKTYSITLDFTNKIPKP